jgi:hypothetical protein
MNEWMRCAAKSGGSRIKYPVSKCSLKNQKSRKRKRACARAGDIFIVLYKWPNFAYSNDLQRGGDRQAIGTRSFQR